MAAIPARSIEDVFEKMDMGKPTYFASDSVRYCDGCELVADWKYDGERLQIHADSSGEVKLFSRSLKDVTERYPEVKDLVANQILCDSIIIDAEVVAVTADGKLQPFQMLARRPRTAKPGSVEAAAVLVFAFDCLLTSFPAFLHLLIDFGHFQLSGNLN